AVVIGAVRSASAARLVLAAPIAAAIVAQVDRRVPDVVACAAASLPVAFAEFANAVVAKASGAIAASVAPDVVVAVAPGGHCAPRAEERGAGGRWAAGVATGRPWLTAEPAGVPASSAHAFARACVADSAGTAAVVIGAVRSASAARLVLAAPIAAAIVAQVDRRVPDVVACAAASLPVAFAEFANAVVARASAALAASVAPDVAVAPGGHCAP